MATKEIDFSKGLSLASDPVSADGGLAVSAGTMQGNAAQARAQGTIIQQKSNDDLLGKLAGVAADAAHGYLESGQEAEIKKTIDYLEKSTKYEDAVNQKTILDIGGEATPEALAAAQRQIDNYKSALDQGVMSRSQALLAIDKTVKEYSNTLPGYASQLRKKAYELTGVEHMGAYREFALLTKDGINEKLAQKRLENMLALEQKALGNFVDRYGYIPSGGVNGPAMKVYQQELALTARADVLKKNLEIKNNTVAQNEEIVTNLVNIRMATGILSLNSQIQGVIGATDPKTGAVIKPEDKAVLRQKILSNASNFVQGLRSEILSFNTGQISNSTREQQLTRLDKIEQDLVNGLKNQDAFDDFRKTMEINAARAQDVTNSWAIANPHLKIYKESGLATPDLAKFWIDSQQDPRRAADFVKKYGKTADDFYRSMSSGGQRAFDYFTSNTTKLSSDPNHLSVIRQTDPGLYQNQLHMIRDNINSIARTGWGQDTETVELRKKSFSNWLTAFANEVDPAKKDMVETWTKMVSDERVAQRIKELPTQEQRMATFPVFDKTRKLLEDPDTGLLKRLDALRESLSSNAQGVAFDVTYNNMTQQFQIINRQVSGAQVGAPSDGGNLGFGEVKYLVQNINRGLETLNNLGELSGQVPKELAARGVALDYFNKYQAGYFNLPYDQRTEALGTPKVESKPKRRASDNLSPADFPKVTPEEQTQRDVGAAKLRLQEVNNDPAMVDARIQEITKEMKKLQGSGRQILQREIKFWEMGKELLKTGGSK